MTNRIQKWFEHGCQNTTYNNIVEQFSQLKLICQQFVESSGVKANGQYSVSK